MERQEPAPPPLCLADQKPVRRDIRNVEPECFRYTHAGRGQKPEEDPGLPRRAAASTGCPVGNGNEPSDFVRCVYIRYRTLLRRIRQQLRRAAPDDRHLRRPRPERSGEQSGTTSGGAGPTRPCGTSPERCRSAHVCRHNLRRRPRSWSEASPACRRRSRRRASARYVVARRRSAWPLLRPSLRYAAQRIEIDLGVVGRSRDGFVP